MRSKYEQSFFDFIWDILGYHALWGPLHRDRVCDFLTDWKRSEAVEGGHDLLRFIKVLLLPREHLKSTIASISLPLWIWTLDPEQHDFPCGPETRFLLSHGKREQACDYLREIKEHITSNERLQWLYPDVFWQKSSESDLWLKDRFNVRRNEPAKTPSMMASGTKASVVGHHFDWFIADDLVFQENVGTATLRGQTLRYFQQCMALVRRGGRVLVPMTRWHHDDLASTLLDPDGPYKNVVDSLVLESGYFAGEPIFPPSKEVPKCGFDMERLEMKRQSMSDYEFFSQYENNPQRDASTSFAVDDICRFRFDADGEIPFEGERAYVIAVDPNRSTDTQNDPCAVVCAAVTDDQHLWVVDIYRGHPSGREMLFRIREMFQRWRPELLCYETAGGQNLWVEELIRDGYAWDIHYPVMEMKRGPNKRKFDRVVSMQPMVERKQLHVPFGGDFDGLVEEMVNFGVAKNDDMVDALADIYSVMHDVLPKPKFVKQNTPPAHKFLLENLLASKRDPGSTRVRRVRPSRGW